MNEPALNLILTEWDGMGCHLTCGKGMGAFDVGFAPVFIFLCFGLGLFEMKVFFLPKKNNKKKSFSFNFEILFDVPIKYFHTLSTLTNTQCTLEPKMKSKTYLYQSCVASISRTHSN